MTSRVAVECWNSLLQLVKLRWRLKTPLALLCISNRRLDGGEYLTLCMAHILIRESHVDLLNGMHKMSNVITTTAVFLKMRLRALYDDREKHEIQLQCIIYLMWRVWLPVLQTFINAHRATTVSVVRLTSVYSSPVKVYNNNRTRWGMNCIYLFISLCNLLLHFNYKTAATI